jgi:hypothetical protein
VVLGHVRRSLGERREVEREITGCHSSLFIVQKLKSPLSDESRACWCEILALRPLRLLRLLRPVKTVEVVKTAKGCLSEHFICVPFANFTCPTENTCFVLCSDVQSQLGTLLIIVMIQKRKRGSWRAHVVLCNQIDCSYIFRTQEYRKKVICKVHPIAEYKSVRLHMVV